MRFLILSGGGSVYHLMSAEIAKRAGAVFWNLEGNEIIMGSYLDYLREKKDTRIPFIACGTEELYRKIRKLI